MKELSRERQNQCERKPCVWWMKGVPTDLQPRIGIRLWSNLQSLATKSRIAGTLACKQEFRLPVYNLQKVWVSKRMLHVFATQKHCH
jgi:hypothetical protein